MHFCPAFGFLLTRPVPTPLSCPSAPMKSLCQLAVLAAGLEDEGGKVALGGVPKPGSTAAVWAVGEARCCRGEGWEMPQNPKCGSSQCAGASTTLGEGLGAAADHWEPGSCTSPLGVIFVLSTLSPQAAQLGRGDPAHPSFTLWHLQPLGRPCLLSAGCRFGSRLGFSALAEPRSPAALDPPWSWGRRVLGRSMTTDSIYF